MTMVYLGEFPTVNTNDREARIRTLERTVQNPFPVATCSELPMSSWKSIGRPAPKPRYQDSRHRWPRSQKEEAMTRRGPRQLAIGVFLALLAFGTAFAQKDTLVVALPVNIPTPDIDQATGLPAIGADAQISDVLVVEKDGKVQPWLAESWTTTDNGRSLVFKIRDGVKCQDGATLTAEDVKWSIDRFRTLSIGRSALAPVTSVTVLDPSHVKVTTKAPFAPLLKTFTYTTIGIYCKEAYDRMGKDAFSRHPVGPGPYSFVEWVPGDHMTLKAFDGYWAGKPAIKNVIFRTILDQQSRIAALEAGDVDVIHAFDPTDYSRLAKNSDLTVYNPPSAGFIRLDMNTQAPPFNDVRVRQAIAYGLDREAFSKQLFDGTAPVSHSLVPANALGYTPKFDVYNYDPAKAKQLLQEAGVPNLSFTLTYGAGRYLLDSDVVTLVQAQLAKIGVHVKIQSMEWAAYSKFIRTAPDQNHTQMSLTWWRTVNGDPDSAIGIFSKEEMPPAGNNVPLYSSNAFETLYKEQQVETDPAKRLQEITDLQKVLMQDLPEIPMYQQPQFWASRANVVGWADVVTPLSTLLPIYQVHFR